MLPKREVHTLRMRFEELVFGAASNRTYGLVMELVDLTDSKSVAKACGFESHLGHQRGIRKIKNVERQ